MTTTATRPNDETPVPCGRCGAPMRDAAPHHGAFVACPYCMAQNLLGEQSAEHRAAQLDRELADYRARAAGQQPMLVAAASRYTRHMQVMAGLVGAANVLFALGASRLPNLLALVLG